MTSGNRLAYHPITDKMIRLRGICGSPVGIALEAVTVYTLMVPGTLYRRFHLIPARLQIGRY